MLVAILHCDGISRMLTEIDGYGKGLKENDKLWLAALSRHLWHGKWKTSDKSHAQVFKFTALWLQQHVWLSFQFWQHFPFLSKWNRKFKDLVNLWIRFSSQSRRRLIILLNGLENTFSVLEDWHKWCFVRLYIAFCWSCVSCLCTAGKQKKVSCVTCRSAMI